MIDYFAIALTHGLIALAAWRLWSRDDLDSEGAENQAPVPPWLKSGGLKVKGEDRDG